MNREVQNKRLACSIFLSSVVHGIILVPFIVVSIVCYASSSPETKEQTIPINFVVKDEIEESVLPKEVEKKEIVEKEDFEYGSVAGINNNELKDVHSENGLAEKIVKLGYDQNKNLQEVEEIKNYFHEMHIVKFCPTGNDMLVIDSYLNNTHHIVQNPTKKDISGYSSDTKVCDFRDFREMKSYVSKTLESEGIESSKYSKVCILVPMKYWLYIINTCDNALSKYDLKVQDKCVEQITIKYIKQGNEWIVKPMFARIRQRGSLSNIKF